jgi:hypothetical protein
MGDWGGYDEGGGDWGNDQSGGGYGGYGDVGAAGGWGGHGGDDGGATKAESSGAASGDGGDGGAAAAAGDGADGKAKKEGVEEKKAGGGIGKHMLDTAKALLFGGATSDPNEQRRRNMRTRHCAAWVFLFPIVPTIMAIATICVGCLILFVTPSECSGTAVYLDVFVTGTVVICYAYFVLQFAYFFGSYDFFAKRCFPENSPLCAFDMCCRLVSCCRCKHIRVAMISYGVIFATAFGWFGVFGSLQALAGTDAQCHIATPMRAGAPYLLYFTWATVIGFWLSFAFIAVMLGLEVYFVCFHKLIETKKHAAAEARLKKLAAEMDSEIAEEDAQAEEDAELKAEAAAALAAERSSAYSDYSEEEQ